MNDTVIPQYAVDLLEAVRAWHREMVRIGNATIDGQVRQTVTPELHNAMMNMVNCANIDAQARADNFQATNIIGHKPMKVFERDPRSAKVQLLDGSLSQRVQQALENE